MELSQRPELRQRVTLSPQVYQGLSILAMPIADLQQLIEVESRSEIARNVHQAAISIQSLGLDLSHARLAPQFPAEYSPHPQ